MGVEPTVARLSDPPTMLKTAESTGTQPSPGPRIAQRRLLCQAQTVTRASRHLPPGSLTTVVPNARICFWAEVAQSVEQRTENAWVPSSSLGLGTCFLGLAKPQLRGRSSAVERLLAKEKVVGSNPIARFVSITYKSCRPVYRDHGSQSRRHIKDLSTAT